MSDLGTDMGNSGLTLAGKALEALVKLFAKLYDTLMKRTSAEYRLKKVELKQAKSKEDKRKFVEKIEGKTGYVAHNDLVKAGVPLTVVGVTLDDKGFKELAARCKREGITISAAEDIRAKGLTGAKFFSVECKQSDVARLKSLFDLLNDEKRISAIEDNIKEVKLENVGLQNELTELENIKNPTTEELERIAALREKVRGNNGYIEALNVQVDEIRLGYCKQLNEKQAESVIEQVIGGEDATEIDFDKAIDRWTGGTIDKDTTCYVVDAKEPTRHIVCNAQNDIYNGENYIKTNYDVYVNNKKVLSTNDGRFDGREKDYWVKQKNAMKEAGGFGNTVFKFYSKESLEKYRANYKAQNASELDALKIGSKGRDYAEIENILFSKMKECGAEYKDGQVYSKETNEPLKVSPEMTTAEKANVAEALIVAKQIENCREIAKLETEVDIAYTNMITSTEGTAQYSEAKAEYEKVDTKYKEALETEKSLCDERKTINAVQAEHDVKHEIEKQGEQANDEHREVSNMERADRADEADKTQYTAKEYNEMIDSRIKENNAVNGVKDKEAVKEKIAPTARNER